MQNSLFFILSKISIFNEMSFLSVFKTEGQSAKLPSGWLHIFCFAIASKGCRCYPHAKNHLRRLILQGKVLIGGEQKLMLRF
jgi:hypothetical protein